MIKIIISALAQNYVIGNSQGKMLWNVKEEFQHFKKTTSGYPIIMGRKTFQTLMKPLPKRLNIVITSNTNFYKEEKELKIFLKLDDALKYCETLNFEKAFIIGGGEIYKQAINLADEMILSFMNFSVDGDVFFPRFDKTNWELISSEKRELFEIIHYKRIVN